MASVVLSGDTSGSVSLTVPLVAGTNTATVPAQTGTLGMMAQGTAVASTSGTSIDFTGIPSWVKRITVMFDQVSTNGSSNILIQIGSGSVSTSGYTSFALYTGGANNTGSTSSTAGMLITGVNGAASSLIGCVTLVAETGNTWVEGASIAQNAFNQISTSGGRIALGGTLDRVRITTVNGTDTFDAGSINILYEG